MEPITSNFSSFTIADILAEALIADRDNLFVAGAQLAEKMLAEASRQAVATNKPASLTIQFNISPQADKQVSIVPEVTSKLPKLKSTSVTAYVDSRGRLQQDDPRQTTLVNKREFGVK